MLIVQNCFSQEYTFDTFLEYTHTQSKESEFYLTNSSNDAYYFLSINGPTTIYGRIIDFKFNMIHLFDILEVGNTLKFKHIFSGGKSNYQGENKKVYEASEKKIDSSTKEIALIIFKNKRKKQIESKITIILEKSEDKFCNTLLNIFSHSRAKDAKFFLENGIILSYKTERDDGSISETKLSKREKINTILSVKATPVKHN